MITSHTPETWQRAIELYAQATEGRTIPYNDLTELQIEKFNADVEEMAWAFESLAPTVPWNIRVDAAMLHLFDVCDPSQGWDEELRGRSTSIRFASLSVIDQQWWRDRVQPVIEHLFGRTELR